MNLLSDFLCSLDLTTHLSNALLLTFRPTFWKGEERRMGGGSVRRRGGESGVLCYGMWQINLRSSETMEPGPYPERPEEPDCSYYIRTGLCRFGATCRFNHPPNRKLAITTARMKGEFPERVGQPECQACISSLYYLKTGTCKFGATCKFHHPRDKAGIAGRVSLNFLGYPLRPNETECAYYLRTGQCKFGSTCKFHHPQPTNMMVSLRGSPIYPTVPSPTTSGQQSFLGGLTNWSRASFIPSPRWQGPSSYAPLILPQGMVSVPSWNTYGDCLREPRIKCGGGWIRPLRSQVNSTGAVTNGSGVGQLASVSSSENLQQTNGNNQIYGTSRPNESASAGSQALFSQFRSGSAPVGFYALQRENVFPERPGEPECQFYMKTGDCKFGAVCRFHHPRERVLPAPDCILSPIGLPLRPVSYINYHLLS
ncbi:zinc finger CCCH domain-containing protein ZFN-like isoform X1 [Gossypium australe]|uniref:Zinc finger CCCH domain-containing protein ZFN-like isoform X1 n=1 Tax=Gossypium australe TaxID=47621 RepID=A0A5B6V5Y1_9ROSI|nr:zinc finger CCCH domain-containing protein ZFN-like isoform X1 [Gossypium australe]